MLRRLLIGSVAVLLASLTGQMVAAQGPANVYMILGPTDGPAGNGFPQASVDNIFGSVGSYANGGSPIFYGPFSHTSSSIAMDQFILQMGTAVSMGSVDNRFNVQPALNLTFILGPTSSSFVMGVDNLSIPAASVAYADGHASMLGYTVWNHKHAGGSETPCANGTGFTSLYQNGIASGSGLCVNSTYSYWTGIPYPVMNLSVAYSDVFAFSPGVALTAPPNGSYPSGYVLLTTSGHTYVIASSPLASVLATYGAGQSPLVGFPPVKKMDGIGSYTSSSSHGKAPSYLMTEESYYAFHNYTASGSIVVVTTVTEP